MSDKIKSKSNKSKIVISIIVVFIIMAIIAAVSILVVVPKIMNKVENVQEKEQLSQWEDAYVSYLQKTILGILNTGENTQMQLINIEGNNIPTLIATFDSTYEGKTSRNLEVYQVNEKGEVLADTCLYNSEGLKILYNKENNNYEWFVCSNTDTNYTYRSLKDMIEAAKRIRANNDTSYQITEYDFYKADENSMKKVQEKFDEKYIEVDCNDTINNWIQYDFSESKEQIMAKLKSEIEKNKKVDTVVSDEKKTEVLNKIEEEKKKIKEENAKKEAEQKIKEEESKLKLTLGKYTLKYGKYTSIEGIDIDPITIVLNADKTCSYSGIEPSGGSKVINEKGTYEIKLNKDDGYGELVDWIILKLNDGTEAPFIVYGNDYFGSQWLAFKYSAETTSISSSNKQSNSTTNTNKTTSSSLNTSVSNNTSSNSSTSENPTLPNAITKDEALKLAKKKWGTHADETGFDIGYTYVSWIQDEKGMQYYVFDVRWLVNNDHWSWIDTVCISADGKTYKEIASPANFKNGEVVKKFDSEGNL